MDANNNDTALTPLPAGQASPRDWLGLAVLALPVLLISVDFSVLNLALPKLTADLRPSSTEQLWILDIYGFMIAGFLVTMGTLGDRIGRRTVLMAGAAAFGASSVLAAFSASPGLLIAARALMGISGATIAPSGLALISAMFKDPKQRGAAVAVFMGCFMGGAVAGPVVGGVLLANFWWGSVFLLAVPVTLLLLATGPRLLPEYLNPGAGRLDPASVLLSLSCILPVIYGATELSRSNADPAAWVSVVAGLVAGALFAARQRRLAHPLLDLGLFGSRVFRGAFSLSLAGGAVQGGSLLMINLYLQEVRGFSPLEAGLWMVPPALAMFVTIGLGPALARTLRPAYVIAAGLAVSAAGYVVVTQAGSTGGLAFLVAGFAVAMAGIGPGMSLGYDMVLGAAPPERAGSASAMVETGGQFGVALGIAVLGSIGAAVYRKDVVIPARVPPVPAGIARDSVIGGVAAARQLPAPAGPDLLASAESAFTSGLHTVSVLGALVFAGLAVLALVTLRQVPPSGQGGTQQDTAPESDRASSAAARN